MKIEKHIEALREVEITIKEALESGNILAYQRRLISMLSLGTQQLIEIYLHKLEVIKPGTQVKHEWFRMGRRNLRIRLSSILTTEIRKVPGLDEILEFAKVIEEDRNELIYGSPLDDDEILREKIDAFLEIKKMVG